MIITGHLCWRNFVHSLEKELGDGKNIERLIRTIEQNRDNLVHLIQKLIRIPSVNTPPEVMEKETNKVL